MSEAWFTWHLAPDGDPEDGCDPQEAAALKDYIHSTTITPETTARAITLAVTNEPKTVRKGQSSDNLYRLWSLSIDALTDLPEHRPKIIRLVQAIQTLPASYRKEGEAQEKQLRWADLPNFGSLWSDSKVSNNWRSNVRKWAPEQREGIRQDYIKQASIDAQLVVAAVSGISISWGLGCICDALERSDAVPDFEVPAAKEWLENTSDRIFEESDREMTGYLRERDLWRQEEGGRKQRWDFWKGRLQSMAESEELGLETRQAAKKAVEAMKAVAK
ncbi:MAG: hypothetical protein ALECFALPRED_003246 [Alectoria fallacina]|uniref:Uncharacterized protein n=1 Tax=Alectoria fallacina TaxID=1903189 RepID=A0A8H3ISJ1_9LECA|nr:MAG: hypothetical protein ALECFALPRED_003246 [Alectoria fallacina]